MGWWPTRATSTWRMPHCCDTNFAPIRSSPSWPSQPKWQIGCSLPMSSHRRRLHPQQQKRPQLRQPSRRLCLQHHPSMLSVRARVATAASASLDLMSPTVPMASNAAVASCIRETAIAILVRRALRQPSACPLTEGSDLVFTASQERRVHRRRHPSQCRLRHRQLRRPLLGEALNARPTHAARCSPVIAAQRFPAWCLAAASPTILHRRRRHLLLSHQRPSLRRRHLRRRHWVLTSVPPTLVARCLRAAAARLHRVCSLDAARPPPHRRRLRRRQARHHHPHPPSSRLSYPMWVVGRRLRI